MPFSDDDLDRYYRDIEARTAGVPGRRARRHPPGADPTTTPDNAATPARACPTPEKNAYRCAADAADTIRHLRSERAAPSSLNAYQCSCGAWHITSRALRPIDPLRRSRGRRAR